MVFQYRMPMDGVAGRFPASQLHIFKSTRILTSLTLASTLSSFLPQMTEHGTAIWATAFPGCYFVLVILELIVMVVVL